MKATRWEDIPDEEVRQGVSRRAFGTEDVLMVMNECQPGMEPRPHKHDFDQIAMITAGEAIYHVDGTPNRVSPGSILLVPAGTEHYIEPVGDETVMNLDVFAPARGDYLHLIEWMREG